MVAKPWMFICPPQWFMLSFILSASLGQKWRVTAMESFGIPLGHSRQQLHSLELFFVLDWKMPLAVWWTCVFWRHSAQHILVHRQCLEIKSCPLYVHVAICLLFEHGVGGGTRLFGVSHLYLTLWFQLGHHTTELSFLLPWVTVEFMTVSSLQARRSFWFP